jgi:HK97 family phage prohead protease
MTVMDADKFRALARKKRGDMVPDASLSRVQTGQPKAYEDGSRKIRFCFSDSSVDRAGDRIMAAGWKTDNFSANPVALWAHDSSQPPIGRASNIAVEGDRLMGDIEFAEASVYPFAETIYQLVKNGFISAVSVGFAPIKYSFVEDADRKWGIDYLETELLEISVVPVPCNANALIEARAAGIDTGPLLIWAKSIVGGEVIQSVKDAADAISETDPASGGFLGKCGRKADEECGMKNAAECEVHGPATADTPEKVLSDIVRYLETLGASDMSVKKGVKPVVRKDAADDADGESHEELLTKALGHFKSAVVHKEMMDDSHMKGLECLAKAIETPADGAEGNPEDEEADKADDTEDKAAVKALHDRAAALLAKHTSK